MEFLTLNVYCLSNSISDWLITWHLHFVNQSESISLLKNYTTILTMISDWFENWYLIRFDQCEWKSLNYQFPSFHPSHKYANADNLFWFNFNEIFYVKNHLGLKPKTCVWLIGIVRYQVNLSIILQYKLWLRVQYYTPIIQNLVYITGSCNWHIFSRSLSRYYYILYTIGAYFFRGIQ